MRLQHTRPDAAAHRMAVQVQRTAIRVILAHRLREFRQIGHIPPPIINPHQGRIVDVTRGIPMSAVLEHAHRVPCEQEVPHHLRIFRGELREPVGDHHGTAECGGGAVLAQPVEFRRVVTHVMQFARTLQRRQTVVVRRCHPAFGPACGERGQHRLAHLVCIAVLVDKLHLHSLHCTAFHAGDGRGKRPASAGVTAGRPDGRQPAATGRRTRAASLPLARRLTSHDLGGFEIADDPIIQPHHRLAQHQAE